MNTIRWDMISDSDNDITVLNGLNAIFIAGSRTISAKRILELAKKYIVKGNVIWGCLQNEYIEGFEDQQQFASLDQEKLSAVLTQFQKFNLPYSFTILNYTQKDLGEILEKITIQKAIFINASWKIAFHRRPEYKIIEAKGIMVKLISPFISEEEARDYNERMVPKIAESNVKKLQTNLTDEACMQLAHQFAKRSFDYTWQTGSVLTKDGNLLLLGHNRVVPFETYMWHTGSLKEHGIGKEKELAHMHNLNNNDTLHAEMDILTQALNMQMDLSECTLFVSLMPCPNCARAIAASKIKRIVYEQEHFGGLAEDILQKAGKEICKLQ